MHLEGYVLHVQAMGLDFLSTVYNRSTAGWVHCSSTFSSSHMPRSRPEVQLQAARRARPESQKPSCQNGMRYGLESSEPNEA